MMLVDPLIKIERLQTTEFVHDDPPRCGRAPAGRQSQRATADCLSSTRGDRTSARPTWWSRCSGPPHTVTAIDVTMMPIPRRTRSRSPIFGAQIGLTTELERPDALHHLPGRPA